MSAGDRSHDAGAHSRAPFPQPFGRFFLPGPTDVHLDVLQAMVRPMFAHRGPEMIAMLSEPPAGLPSEVPFLLAMTRGKLYLRMQLEAEDGGEAGHYALDALKLFSARALKCFGR